MEVQVIKDEQSFVALKETWNDIHKKMCDATPFQTWEWNYHWWNSHTDGLELHLLVAFEGKEVFGIAPLVIENKTICFIGNKHFDYGMFVCAERKREIAALFFLQIKKIAKERKVTVVLRNIPGRSDQFALYKDFAHKTKRSVWREVVDTANVNLNEYSGFDGYLKAISASLRKKAIKPCVNAEIQYEIEPFSDSLWADIEQIYQNRMEDRVGTSNLDWARDVVRELSAAELLHISTLKYNGERVAFLIFFEVKDSNYVWLTAFKKTEKFQLGHYIRYVLIKRAYERKIEKVDMMRGAYAYKKHWDCNTAENWELIIFRSYLKRSAYVAWKKIRPKLKNIVYNNKVLKRIYIRAGKRNEKNTDFVRRNNKL